MKKLFATLLAMLLLTGVLPTAVFAKGETAGLASDGVTRILSAEVTVTAPREGEQPDFFAAVPSGMGYRTDDYNDSNWKNGVRWLNKTDGVYMEPSSDPFEEGKEYEVSVFLIPESDAYVFDDDQLTAAINGNTVEPRFHPDGCVSVKCTFLCSVEVGAILGDADDDGDVTILDATAVQRYLAELSVESFNAHTADADEDGEITILDATAIQRFLAELSTNPRIGNTA